MKQTKHLYIISRADEKIGLGHLIRCFNIAKFFEKDFENITFVLNRDAKKFVNYYKKSFNFKKKTVFRFSKTNSIESIDKKIKSIVSSNTVNYLLIDIENFSKKYESNLKKIFNKQIILDDFLKKNHPSDLVLCSNERETDSYLKKFNRKKEDVFASPSICLLNKINKSFKKKSKKLKSVLVYLGTNDKYEVALKVLKTLRKRKNLKIYFINGENKYLDKVKNIAADRDDIFIYERLPSLDEIYKKVDFAIGACGISQWERILYEIPSLITSTSRNQNEDCSILSLQGSAVFLGKSYLLNEKILDEKIDFFLRKNKHTKMYTCIEKIRKKLKKDSEIFKYLFLKSS